MVKWSDQVRDHAALQMLRDLADHVRRIDVSADEHSESTLQHIAAVVDHVSFRVSAADLELVSPAMLQGVANAAHSLANNMASYEESPQTSYLDQAVVAADGLLTSLSPLPPPVREKQIESLQAQAKEFRATSALMLKEMRGEVRALHSQADTLRSEIAEGTTANANDLSTVRSQVEQLAATIEQQAGRLDTALTDFQSQTSTALTTLETRFTTAETDRVAAVNEANSAELDSFKARAEESEAGYRAKADATIADLVNLRDRAAELVGVVTGTATAGHFKIVADGEQQAADFWRWVAVGVAALVVGIGVWLAIAAHDVESFDWARFMAKAFLTIPLSVVAAYAGKQSGSHRRMERTARHKQLQLAALEPFIEPLETDKQAEIRAQLAAHLFGPEPPDQEHNGEHELNAAAVAQALFTHAVAQAKK